MQHSELPRFVTPSLSCLTITVVLLKTIRKFAEALISGAQVVAILLVGVAAVSGQTFSDSFNRPDGPVGNGWTTWGNGAAISGGQLATFGEPNVAGGVARQLPVTFPLTFSFDFRTDAPSDGGWAIGFNAATAGFVASTAEFTLFQYAGSRFLGYEYQTSTGLQIAEIPVVNGQEDYQSSALAHISGTVNADLSASVTITYADGTRVSLQTPAPTGAEIAPRGSFLVLGNSNATYGPHFFANFNIGWGAGQTCTPPPSGLVAWWPGDDNYNDIIGGNTGAPVGGITFTPNGEVGPAFSFNGADAAVQIPDSPALRPQTLTIDFLVNPTSYPTSPNLVPLVFKSHANGTWSSYVVALESDGTILFSVQNQLLGQWPQWHAKTAVPLNQWTHVAVTYAAQTFTVSDGAIYINGVQQLIPSLAGGPYSSGFSIYYDAEPLAFGRDLLYNNEFSVFAGQLDEVDLFNRVLSASEIQAIYNAGSAGKCKPASCTYTFNPTSQSFGANGGPGLFTVSTGPSCPSSPVTNDSWIHPWYPDCPASGIVPGCNNNGSRTVNFVVDANNGSARNGGISVGNQQFQVEQGAFSCTDTISPTFAFPNDLGGNLFVSVSAPRGCGWSAMSNAPWITVKSGSPGSGGGVVTLSVAANNGGTRSGTATVAGNAFSVTQGAGACGALDVSSQTNVFETGLTWIPLSDYSQAITVTNASGSVIHGPVYVVLLGEPTHLGYPDDSFLVGSQLTTKCFSSGGDYLLPVSFGDLKPGQKAGYQLLWTTQTFGRIGYTTKVLSGTPSK